MTSGYRVWGGDEVDRRQIRRGEGVAVRNRRYLYPNQLPQITPNRTQPNSPTHLPQASITPTSSNTPILYAHYHISPCYSFRGVSVICHHTRNRNISPNFILSNRLTVKWIAKYIRLEFFTNRKSHESRLSHLSSWLDHSIHPTSTLLNRHTTLSIDLTYQSPSSIPDVF